MPPRKQPKTLQELCLKTVARLTSELCVNIERKHGDWKCQASRDELEIAKMYLSSIPHLFDDLWKEVYEMRFCSRDIQRALGISGLHLLLELLMCDKLRILHVSDIYYNMRTRTGFFVDSIFWKNQILKLKNVVELVIPYVRLTDECFQAIGDVCTNVRKLRITSDLKYASMESLKHILKCQELRKVEIDFLNWDDGRTHSEYVGMLVLGLPNLEYFHDLFHYWDMKEVIALTIPLSSIRKLDLDITNSVGLTEIICLCPNLTDIKLSLGYYPTSARIVEQDKALKVLTESSLQLKTLKLDKLAFSNEVTRMISCKGSHLTSLDIEVCEGRRLSVNDVYTIGVSCPKLVELGITEFNDRPSNGPIMEEQKFVDPPPPMFVGLKTLYLYANIDWDQRILPLILRHADNLTSVTLSVELQPSDNSLDPLSQILNANALQQLESLHIDAEWYGNEDYTILLPKAPIERLLDCCHKLTKLNILCEMEDETIDYLEDQQSYIKSKNFDLTFGFTPVTSFD